MYTIYKYMHIYNIYIYIIDCVDMFVNIFVDMFINMCLYLFTYIFIDMFIKIFIYLFIYLDIFVFCLLQHRECVGPGCLLTICLR